MQTGVRTSGLVIHVHFVESLAANGAAVCLCCPFPQTGVVQKMTANFDASHICLDMTVPMRPAHDNICTQLRIRGRGGKTLPPW